jgi:hypothetical protein
MADDQALPGAGHENLKLTTPSHDQFTVASIWIVPSVSRQSAINCTDQPAKPQRHLAQDLYQWSFSYFTNADHADL